MTNWLIVVVRGLFDQFQRFLSLQLRVVLSLGVEATLGLGNFAPKEDQGNILGSSFG